MNTTHIADWVNLLQQTCADIKMTHLDFVLDQCGIDFSVIPVLRDFSSPLVWQSLYQGSACGDFRDLIAYGRELLAVTSKGIYASTNGGKSWMMRYVGSACGEFLTILDGGGELLATTTKGLYRSTNGGSTWLRR